MERFINFGNINMTYVELIIDSLLVWGILEIIKWISKKIIGNIKNEKVAYNTFSFIRIISNLALFILLIIIWSEHINNIITLISFLSAAFAIAVRDIILNWFCGIYIKIHRPFKLEDRIEVDGIKGDVIDLSLFSFDILEISNKDEFGQSTGSIITIPNSQVFAVPIKNLTKSFKYIWNEIEVPIPLESDVAIAKKTLYKIINEIDIVKSIPKKMKNQISEINTTYRIYYNNYEPIIYMKIDGPKMILSLRYLVHPKKARYVSSLIWNKIYAANLAKTIELYKGDE